MKRLAGAACLLALTAGLAIGAGPDREQTGAARCFRGHRPELRLLARSRRDFRRTRRLGESGAGTPHRNPVAMDRPESVFSFHLPLRAAQSETRAKDGNRDQRAVEMGCGGGVHRFGHEEHPALQGIRNLAAGRMDRSRYRSRRSAARRRMGVELRIPVLRPHRPGRRRPGTRFMRIPYAAVDTRAAAAGNTLRVNFFRSQGARPNHKSIVWQPTHRPTFHVPEVFGTLKLVD